jgi:diketogulonate reductase-like aldo/keto reductase
VDVIVNRIAKELGITDDQVLIKWAHQVTYGGIIVTSSLKKDRLVGQMRALFEVKELSEGQVQEIAEAGMTKHQSMGELQDCV